VGREIVDSSKIRRSRVGRTRCAAHSSAAACSGHQPGDLEFDGRRSPLVVRDRADSGILRFRITAGHPAANADSPGSGRCSRSGTFFLPGHVGRSGDRGSNFGFPIATSGTARHGRRTDASGAGTGQRPAARHRDEGRGCSPSQHHLSRTSWKSDARNHQGLLRRHPLGRVHDFWEVGEECSRRPPRHHRRPCEEWRHLEGVPDHGGSNWHLLNLGRPYDSSAGSAICLWVGASPRRAMILTSIAAGAARHEIFPTLEPPPNGEQRERVAAIPLNGGSRVPHSAAGH
jgi:hypothetical protein